MNKRILIALMLILSLVSVACGAETIKIGYIAHLTGDGATWGVHEQNGALLAVEEINKAGGVLGRPLELIVYDVRGRQEDAINAARRLTQVDKVVAIGGTNWSGINIATGPIVEQAKVPQIGSFSTNPAVTVDPATKKVKPYSFRICFTDPYQGKVMAEYLIKKGIKKAAVLNDVGSDYSEGLKEFFMENFKKLGGTVYGPYSYRGGDVDFRAQLTNAKSSGAQALVMTSGTYKEMALQIKQSAELGWKPVFIGGDGYSPNMYEVAGDAMDNSYWIYHMSFQDPKLDPLYAKYEKKYGTKATEIVNVVAAYDIVYWITDAIKRAGKAEGPAIRDALENTKNLKLLHFTLTLDKATHNPLNKPAAILQFKKDKKEAIYLETFAPQSSF